MRFVTVAKFGDTNDVRDYGVIGLANSMLIYRQQFTLIEIRRKVSMNGIIRTTNHISPPPLHSKNKLCNICFNYQRG